MLQKLKGLLEKRDGEVIGIASTADPDRDGEVIDQKGWILEPFLENPVILAHHNYHNFPIGKAIDIAVHDGKLMFKMVFSQATEEAKQAFQLVQEGILRTFSVGYIPREYDPKDQNRTTKAELLEISLVAVPANPKAVVYAKSFKENDLAVQLCKEWLLDEKLRKEVDELEKKEADEEKEKAKGAIMDRLENPSEWQIKEEYCRQVWKVMDAFFGLYWDETVPASDFTPLMKEVSKILGKLATDGVIGKGALKGLVDDDEDDEDDDDMMAKKEAKFKQFLAVITGKESTPPVGNDEEGEEGAKVEVKHLDIRSLQKVTGSLQELLHAAKAARKGGASKL